MPRLPSRIIFQIVMAAVPPGPSSHPCRANQWQARWSLAILGSERQTGTAALARQASVAFLNVDCLYIDGAALAATKLRDDTVVKLGMRRSGSRA